MVATFSFLCIPIERRIILSPPVRGDLWGIKIFQKNFPLLTLKLAGSGGIYQRCHPEQNQIKPPISPLKWRLKFFKNFQKKKKKRTKIRFYIFVIGAISRFIFLIPIPENAISPIFSLIPTIVPVPYCG